MPKKKTAKFTKTKRPVRWHKSDGWFFARRAPDLPFWIFLVLGILVLVLFGLWLKNPKEATVENLVVPTLTLPRSVSDEPTAPNPLTAPAKTITITDAADPSIVTNLGKIYVTFRNNTGGYSVAVYDADLTILEAPRWITNGSVIPAQQVAAPIFAGENWYLAYLGGDGFTRLAKYDADFNPQRSITFRTALTALKNPLISLIAPITLTGDLMVKLYDGTTRHLFSASPDLGLELDQNAASENWTYTPDLIKTVTLGTKTYTAEASGTTVTLKLLQ